MKAQYKVRDYLKLLSPGLIIMIDRSEIIISFHTPCEDGCTLCKFKTNLGTQISQTSAGWFLRFLVGSGFGSKNRVQGIHMGQD
jgi:hypothetical protein